MAHNNEEIEIMKATRYITLVLLSSLLIMLTGCERRELLDDYPVSGVQVNLNWNGVTDKLPEGMKIVFYPKDDEGVKVESYLSAMGGEVLKVPPGRYAVAIYNYDTEGTVALRDEGLYERVEAYAAPCNEPGAKSGMVWGPELLYTAKIDELNIAKSDEVLVVELRPEPSVYTYSFEVKAKGLKNVSDITGSVAGMDVCYALGCRDCSTCRTFPIFFRAAKGDGVIKGSFSAFGPLAHSATRANGEVVLTLELLKIDGEVQKVEVNITEVVAPSPPEGGGGEPPKKDVEIEIPIDDDEIVIDDVKPIPPTGGGGIGGDVGDWGPEDNVELPMK